MERKNYYTNKVCQRCSNVYFGYKISKRCEACRKKAKVEWEKNRLQDKEYKERRAKSVKAWYLANKDKKYEYNKNWAKKNSDKMVEYQKQWAKRNPDKYREKNRRRNLSQFGITTEDYAELLNSQGDVCAICRKTCKTGRRLAVDHNHKTGKVRGLLCNNCNQGLGKFKDSKELIMQAYEYLKRFNS